MPALSDRVLELALEDRFKDAHHILNRVFDRPKEQRPRIKIYSSDLISSPLPASTPQVDFSDNCTHRFAQKCFNLPTPSPL